MPYPGVFVANIYLLTIINLLHLSGISLSCYFSEDVGVVGEYKAINYVNLERMLMFIVNIGVVYAYVG